MNAATREVYVHCGFTVAAAAAIFDDQGIDSLPKLRILTDLEVENLCKVIRRLGGSVQNPIEGHAMSLRAKNNLKLAAYWLRQQDKVARVVTPAQVLLDTMRAVRAKRDADAAYKNQITADYPVINDKDWPKTNELIVRFLGTCLGETKILLAYVIRETVGLPEGNDPLNQYAGLAKEMIRCALHNSKAFELDRKKVWEMFSKMTKEADCWTYVKPAQRTQDGRAAFHMLFDHYLGANNVNNMALEADFTLAKGH
jgi:hypothetical protein